MKLFYVTSVFNGMARPVHVHAKHSVEAYTIACTLHGRHYAAQVYDLSQSALCAGVLDLDDCPMDTFKA